MTKIFESLNQTFTEKKNKCGALMYRIQYFFTLKGKLYQNFLSSQLKLLRLSSNQVGREKRDGEEGGVEGGWTVFQGKLVSWGQISRWQGINGWGEHIKGD